MAAWLLIVVQRLSRPHRACNQAFCVAQTWRTYTRGSGPRSQTSQPGHLLLSRSGTRRATAARSARPRAAANPAAPQACQRLSAHTHHTTRMQQARDLPHHRQSRRHGTCTALPPAPLTPPYNPECHPPSPACGAWPRAPGPWRCASSTACAPCGRPRWDSPELLLEPPRKASAACSARPHAVIHERRWLLIVAARASSA